MKTLNISISDVEYNKFGLKDQRLSFSDLVELIRNQITLQNFNDCLELAERYGLSKLTMDEISAEVRAVRNNAKNNS